MGELSDYFGSEGNFRRDGSQRETDEDGKPVGDFHNPHHPGGEDMPHELSGQPLQTPSTPAKPASNMGSMYRDGPGGTYTHVSAEHTGKSTAEACGVDLSQFEDSGRD